MSRLIQALLKKVFMKFITNNAEIQKVSLQFFYMADQVVELESFPDGSSIQKNIE